MKVFISLQIFLILFVNIAVCLHCKNEKGENVDWYYLYKIPHIKKQAPNELLRTGYAYLYIDSNNVTNWTLSDLSINDKNSFLGQTLQPLYDPTRQDSTMHVLYNDQPPNKNPRLNKGHTKGLVLGDQVTGFWLVHSVPLFPPPAPGSYQYPATGAVYGQSALCITMDADNLNLVGTQLQYNEIEIYSTNMPINLTLAYPKINDVINHNVISNAPWFHTNPLKSFGGVEFLSFAKTKNFGKDLYEDWVAPALRSNLYVESWLNGAGKLNSNCSKPFSVYNIQDIKLDSAKVMFRSALDHSKWAVNNATTWACVGDINRAEHQKHRGGGTVCINDKRIASFYRETIAQTESCNKTLSAL